MALMDKHGIGTDASIPQHIVAWIQVQSYFTNVFIEGCCKFLVGWHGWALTDEENICNRNYVMVCGPGEDGQRGERIPKGGKKGKGKAGLPSGLCRCLSALSSLFLGKERQRWQGPRREASVAAHGPLAGRMRVCVACASRARRMRVRERKLQSNRRGSDCSGPELLRGLRGGRFGEWANFDPFCA